MGEGAHSAQAGFVVGGVAADGGEVEASGELGGGGAQPGGEGGREVGRGEDDEKLAFGMGQEIGEGEVARAFGGAGFAEAEQAAEPAPGGAILRVADEIRRVGKAQAGAGEQAQTGQQIGLAHTDGRRQLAQRFGEFTGLA